MCPAIVVLFSILFCNLFVQGLVPSCPEHFVCDMHQTLRRASCRNRSLVSVEAHIPRQVQWLDISYNFIDQLSDHVFVDLNLTYLKVLDLSHNKIGQIHMNAFSDMHVIKRIDLSYNNIEYLLENWFWNIPTLEELILRHNNLRTLKPGPIIESKSLKVLSLSNCLIPAIHADTFSKLPNLEQLDLSENMLIQLSINALTPLTNLKQLNLDQNLWHCNSALIALVNYCKTKQINTTEVCTKPTTPVVEKFQKMVVAPEATTELHHTWVFEDEPETKIFSNEIAKDKTTVCPTETIYRRTILLQLIKINPYLTLGIFCMAGFILGMICTCIVMQEQKSRRKRYHPKRKNIIFTSYKCSRYDRPLIQSESYEVGLSTPVATRKNFQQ